MYHNGDRRHVLWGMLSDARNNIHVKKWDLFPHIPKDPTGRMVPRLDNSLAQRHDLLALRSSDVPTQSYKMAAAVPEITSSSNYGQMPQCLSSFHQRERPFLESHSRLHLYLIGLNEVSILILNIIIGKGEWDYHNWFKPVVGFRTSV